MTKPGRGLAEHDMSDGVRVWAVDESDSLKEMEPSKLDYEDRIETWMSNNVSVLVPDDSGLLVIWTPGTDRLRRANRLALHKRRWGSCYRRTQARQDLS